MTVRLIHGDMREKVGDLADASIDAIVTDPPYHLTTGKKGGTGPASLNEDSPAGRARIGTGFMGKKWDGGDIAMRPETWALLLRVAKPGAHLLAFGGSRTFHRVWCAVEDAGWELRDTLMWLHGEGFPKSSNQDGAWQGWGTALKPAFEPIVMARKPLIGTVAGNLSRHGVGALNIDACRIGYEADDLAQNYRKHPPRTDKVSSTVYGAGRSQHSVEPNGRWPANVLHDGSERVLEAFPNTKSAGIARDASEGTHSGKKADGWGNMGAPAMRFGDDGSAARFFWCPKASRQDRNEGLGDMENFHPTVKPTELMQYLCRLVTPRGGVVLDPFVGSGSTGKAAVREDFSFIGIDLEEQHIELSRRRITGVAPLFADVRIE